MTTVMGQVDKEPIRLVAVLGNQSDSKHSEYSAKLKNFVEFTGKKIAEMFLAVREDFEFRGLEVTAYTCLITDFQQKLKDIRSDRKDIVLGVLVGKFPEFSSRHDGFDNYFLVPDKMMRNLPEDVKVMESYVKHSKKVTDELFTHMVHEIFHSLGAFHADTGVMSGYPRLLTGEGAKIEDVKLVNHTDQKTIHIVCESLSIITTLAPQRDLNYNPAICRLTYETDQSISAVFFVKNDKYTSSYKQFTYLDACKKYSELTPDDWDGFVVVHFCGHIFFYTKNDVLTTKRCSRKKIF